MQTLNAGQAGLKAGFGCDVEHLLWTSIKQVRARPKEYPVKPMPFQ
jgi:hypothetical protein